MEVQQDRVETDKSKHLINVLGAIFGIALMAPFTWYFIQENLVSINPFLLPFSAVTFILGLWGLIIFLRSTRKESSPLGMYYLRLVVIAMILILGAYQIYRNLLF